MPDVTFTSIKVRCPVFPHRIEPMTMEFFRTENPKEMLPYCNGCDSANGSDICQKCIAILVTYFERQPDALCFGPIDPFSQDINLLGLTP